MSGRQRHLIYAGLWIGIAFQAKMLEAWLVLPAFGLAYLFGRTDGWAHKLRQVAVAGLVAGVVSLSWMTIVTLTPAHDRPYVDGSQHNSVYEQVFVYNGFGRAQPAGRHSSSFSGDSTCPRRCSTGRHRHGIGSSKEIPGAIPAGSYPLALVVGVGGLFTRRRSYFILWTGWLIPMVVVFSDVFIFHSYYTTALSPPMAAILGAGIAALWESRTERRSVAARRGAAAALLVAGTVVYGIWLHPIVGGDCADLAVAAGDLAGGGGGRAPAGLGRGWTRRGLLAVALLVGTAAVLVVPATASALLVPEQRGVSDTPFESAKTAALYDALLGHRRRVSARSSLSWRSSRWVLPT